MNNFNKIMDYIFSRTSINLLRAGFLLPVIFFSSISNAAESVCAVVKIEIQQEITLERQAFDAKMKINNNLAGVTLEQVGVSVLFKDENGDSVLASSDPNNTTAKFFIKIDDANLAVDAGTATVGPQSTLEAHWLIIPAPGASGNITTGKLYSVGAVLTYVQGGEQKEITVAPDTIFVKPLPLLSIDYFLEEKVYADDAFTPDVVEPSVPFTLGVRINNSGSAAASNFKIDSAQPTITENDQGLKIGFNIIGSSVNDQPASNSLLMNFGDISPASSTVGRWDMVTTLSGTFTEFSAEFTHADELGGKLTSIIDPAGIKTHFLVHNVLVDLPGRDLIRDFLAIDGDVYRVYESNGVDTVVDTIITDFTPGTSLTTDDSGSEVRLALTIPISAGFSYVSLTDKFAGTKVIKQMVRSDGKTIPLANAWLHKTRKANPADGWDYFVNFFDVNSTGTYSVLMGAPDLGPVPPEFTPLLNVTTYETASVTFPVAATDPNGDAVTLSAGTLPEGATFTSDTSGSGKFTWSPAIGQAGNYTVSFTASDGTLSKQTSVTIKVNSVTDTDGDGMNDDWERAMFGDLSRDGTGDADGDGISDLQEYLNQTDPNLPPPLVPTNLVALPGNAENTLSWDTITGVDTYNIYWSLTNSVSPTTGNLVNAITSPHVHSGLDNDVTYYYIVTSVGAGGESAASNIVSVTTGVRDWTAPKVFSNAAGTFAQNINIAMTANGDAIAVWQQTNLDINTVMASRYVVGTGWSVPIAISSTTLNATNAIVLMDESGNAIAVWQEGGVTQSDILAARYDVVTGWETVVKIENDGSQAAINPQLAMTKSGNAVVVWQQGSSLYNNHYDALSGWQTESLLADETNFSLSDLKLAINESGEGFATWTVSQDQTSFDLRLSQLTSNTWSSPTSVAIGLDNAISPAITVNDSGNALLAWSAFDGTRHVLMASDYTTAGGWITAQAISNSIGDAQSSQLVMDATGNAYVTWRQSSSPYSVYVKRYDAVASWQTTDIIEQRERGNASNPQISLDLRGNVVVTWQQDDGVQQNILAAVYDKATSSWRDERVIETNNSGHATSPVIAMNDSGNAIVAWQQDNAGERVVSTNHYEAGNTGIPNIAPIAVAGADQTVDEQTVVTLDGGASFDQDGSGLITSYNWTQTGGTTGTTVTLINAATATPNFTSPIVLVTESPQTLTFELTVTDDANATSTKTVNVIVNAVNSVPVANAGTEQTVDEQSAVTLSGSGTDTDGTVDAYSWSQVSGTAVTLTNANTATATFTSPIVLVQDGAQTLTFRLTVIDNETATVFDDINVVVNPVNADPIANAGIDQTVNEQTAVTLTGSASDADGSITTYQWTQTGGVAVTLTNANAALATFTSPVVLVQDGAQTLTFRLTVTDNETATIFDDVSIIVDPVNAIPTADAGASRAVNEQTPITLNGSGADTDGSITAYQWTQITGPVVTLTNANTATPNFTTPVVLVANSPTVLTFRLTVTDNETAIATSETTIGVMAVNALPVTNAGVDQTVNEQTAVSLIASGSDSDGNIASYQWTQVSGLPVTLATANTATATFTSPVVLVQEGAQALTFRATVTDNEGGTHTDDMTVTVQPANALPIANAGTDQRIAEYETVTLSGLGSDSDGLITAYQWTQVSGLPVVISNSTSAAASFVAPPVYQDEVLSFNLVVTDNETGVSIADSINITLFSVNPDDDADGLPDLYEIANFGTLSRDGTADFDNDGYSDLQEYLQGTNPLAFTLPAPTGLKAVAADAQVTLSWNNIADAVAYNVYWDTVPNVTKTSNVINNVSSGYIHTGLANGTTYYYVVTALSSGDESIVSDEVSSIPGKRTWQAPSAIDNATTTYFYPQIAVNRTGQSVVVYEQFDGVAYSAWASIYNKDTGWSTAQAIETENAGHVYNPQVSIDENGNAVAVWEQYSGTSYNVWANVYDAQNASWGIAEQVETSLTGGAEYFMPQVDMSKNGSAVVTWQKHDGLAISIWVSRYEMGLGWTQAIKLENNDSFSAYMPKVSANSLGNAAVVWEQYDSVSASNSTWGTYYNATTGWSTASVLSNVDNQSAYDSQIALSDSGRAVAVWEQFDGTRFNVWTNVAQNGVWGTAEHVEYNTTGANEYYVPQVAMDNSGNAMVVWQQFDGSHLSAWSNRFVNGAWEVAQRIEANEITPVTNPKIAMDEEGNAVAVWEQYDDSSKNSLISVWSNRYSISSGWGSAQPMEVNDTETMWYPEVAMDAYGNAKAIWFNNGLTGDNILVAENILQTNPPTANAGIDQTGVAAKDTVVLDASASSDVDGSIVNYHWHQIGGEEVSLDNKNTVAPSFSAPRISSELTFILTVTDNDGLTSSDTVVITVGDVSVTGLIINLLGNSGKIATHGLASGVMPEQWALNHGPKTIKNNGKSKFSGRLESFSIDRNARGTSGREKPIKDIK